MKVNIFNYLWERLAEPSLLVVIFFASQLPMRDFDIWFHIKAGEQFVTQGLTFVERFSHAAGGRPWIAFEWLYQIIVYKLSLVGLWTLPLFTSVFTVLIVAGLLAILRLYRVNLILRMLLALVFFVFGYEFFTVRPHVLAYSFIIWEIYLILLFLKNGSRWLYFLPLLVFFWTNIHSTGFLSWGLLAAFAATQLLGNLSKRGIAPASNAVRNETKHEIAALPARNDMRKIRTLLILALICLIITLLPPKWFLDYQLLWRFYRERKFLGTFIAEWAPTLEDTTTYGILFYLSFCLMAAISIGINWWRNRNWRVLIRQGVFAFLIIMGYSATRNLILGAFGTLSVIGINSTQIPLPIHKYKWLSGVLLSLGAGIAIYFSYIFYIKQAIIASEKHYFPVAAAEFTKKYLKGRMFNEYAYGGYLAYAVYPILQVFLDGRAEVYMCCEMRDYLSLSVNKYLPDEEYRKFLQKFIDKYGFNFFIVSGGKHNVMRRIATLINTDPRWALVFWDDFSQVFVRRDGVNDGIIKQLEVKAATPYLRDPFVKGQEEQAFSEYNRMDGIVKSSRTSNAIGYLQLLNNNFEAARGRFREALNLDPTFESPYMNLGELAVRDGNLDLAIGLYSKARSLASDRGLIYIRLGELMYEKTKNLAEAKKIWRIGAELTVDSEAKEKLRKLLEK